MREAAKVLREATERHRTNEPCWHPVGLEDVANQFEAEDAAKAEQDALEWQLANEIVEALPVQTGIHNGIFHAAACKLYAHGWRKQVQP